MTTDCEDDPRSRTDRKASWLSLGFEELVRSIGTSSATHPMPGSVWDPFDILIVGSGYGGAIAAAQFAGAIEQTGADGNVVAAAGEVDADGACLGAHACTLAFSAIRNARNASITCSVVRSAGWAVESTMMSASA